MLYQIFLGTFKYPLISKRYEYFNMKRPSGKYIFTEKGLFCFQA